MANKVLIKFPATGSSTWATAIGVDGYHNAVTLAQDHQADVRPTTEGKGWKVVDKNNNVLAVITPLGGEDDLDQTGATQQNLPAAINSTQDALGTTIQETASKGLNKDMKSKKIISETPSVVNFLKSFSTKNYAQANKYLEEVINSKLKKRIELASKEPLFK